MRSLRPFTLATLGPLLLGIILAIVAFSVMVDFRNARGIAISFALGAVFGIIMFVPIAAAEAFRAGLQRALGPRLFDINWFVSLGLTK